MTLVKCKECGHEISDEALACPNCGFPQRNRHPSMSVSSQLVVYAVSLFLPPFGLWYVWKYLKQKDTKSKVIGIICLILTIISIIFTIRFIQGFINSFNEALNSVDIYNF